VGSIGFWKALAAAPKTWLWGGGAARRVRRPWITANAQRLGVDPAGVLERGALEGLVGKAEAEWTPPPSLPEPRTGL